jgi:hypothetical protein
LVSCDIWLGTIRADTRVGKVDLDPKVSIHHRIQLHSNVGIQTIDAGRQRLTGKGGRVNEVLSYLITHVCRGRSSADLGASVELGMAPEDCERSEIRSDYA